MDGNLTLHSRWGLWAGISGIQQQVCFFLVMGFFALVSLVIL